MWHIFDQKCGLKWLFLAPPNCWQLCLFLTFFTIKRSFLKKKFPAATNYTDTILCKLIEHTGNKITILPTPHFLRFSY